MEKQVNQSEFSTSKGGRRRTRKRKADNGGEGRISIQNPKALAALIADALGNRSLRAASRDCGISQPLLSRLCRALDPARATVKEISRSNYARLFRVIPPEKHLPLRRAFVIGTAARIRDWYTDWVWQQVQRASNGHYLRWYWTPIGLASYTPSPVKMGTSDRDLERLALRKYLRERKPDLHQAIETTLRKVRVSGYRELAWTRILDPLINSSDSGFVEPSWREWCRTKPGRARLIKFVRAGFRREQMLLTGRVSPTQRAKSIWGMSQDEFVARFGSFTTEPHNPVVDTERGERIAASVTWATLDRSRYQTPS